MPHLTLLNGPNLNLLGQRQPDIYGHDTLADVERMVTDAATAAGWTVTCLQSNHEGILIDAVHTARDTSQAIIINPGGLTHTSVALLDALNAFDGVVVEVHISDIHKREAFRHHSYVSLRADHVICGEGVKGYVMGVEKIVG